MEQLSKLSARRKRSSVTRLTKNSKFFIICEASSQVQVKAIADFVEDHVKTQLGESPYRHEGRQAAHWILIDYVNIVVHVMQSETRKFYKLEEMWSDGETEEL